MKSEELIQYLKAYMAANNITYDEMGKKLGVGKSTISGWINDDREPKADHAFRIQELVLGSEQKFVLISDEDMAKLTMKDITTLREIAKLMIFFNESHSKAKEEAKEKEENSD